MGEDSLIIKLVISPAPQKLPIQAPEQMPTNQVSQPQAEPRAKPRKERTHKTDITIAVFFLPKESPRKPTKS